MFCIFDINDLRLRASRWLFSLAAILLIGMVHLLGAAENESLIKAREAARRADWDEAAAMAQQAVSQEPDNAGAWSLLAEAQLNLGDTTAAVSSFQSALGEDPKQPAAVLGLTRYYLLKKNISAADSVVATAEEKDKKGKSDEIKVARGMILAQQGQFAEARTIITSAAEKNKKNALYPLVLARIYEDQNVHDLAEENYAKAWALDPGNATLAYEYGVVLQEQKKYNEALDLFKVVQEKDPGNKTVDYLVGRLYFAAKRYAEAATQFEKAVEKRPDHFLSNLLLGRSYIELSKAEKKNFYARAVPSLRKAYELRPERQDARQFLADALLNQSKAMHAMANATNSQDQEALSDLTRLLFDRIIRNAENANAQELADVLKRVKAEDRRQIDSTAHSAAQYFDSSLVLAREAVRLDSAILGAHAQIAKVFDKTGMLDSAAYHEEIEVRLNPADRNELTRLVNIYQRQKKQASLVQLLEPLTQDSTIGSTIVSRFGLILVNAYSETNDYDKARSLVKQIITQDSTNCNAHQTYAYIVLKRERYAEAISVLRAGVAACPKDCDMWVQLGDSWYFSDQKSKSAVTSARDAYARACQLGCTDGCQKKEQVEAILARPGLK